VELDAMALLSLPLLLALLLARQAQPPLGSHPRLVVFSITQKKTFKLIYKKYKKNITIHIQTAEV
jgi:hypothetical protein